MNGDIFGINLPKGGHDKSIRKAWEAYLESTFRKEDTVRG